MKMKQISDSTIKITIQLEDLEERGMEIADFLVPQEKTEEFFYAILDELEMPESFLDAEAIHHLEQEELRDNQEQDPTSEAPVSQYIYYILRFSNIQQAVAFSKMVSFPVDTSELYKMGSDYYLTVLIDTEDQPTQYPTWLLAIIREYADDSEVTRAVLQEHGHLLMVSGAIENLKKVASL